MDTRGLAESAFHLLRTGIAGWVIGTLAPIMPKNWQYCPFCGVLNPRPGAHRMIRGEDGSTSDCPGEYWQQKRWTGHNVWEDTPLGKSTRRYRRR